MAKSKRRRAPSTTWSAVWRPGRTSSLVSCLLWGSPGRHPRVGRVSRLASRGASRRRLGRLRACFFHPFPGTTSESVNATSAPSPRMPRRSARRVPPARLPRGVRGPTPKLAHPRRALRHHLAFRFKRDAGMCDGDPWWNGGAARRNPFCRDGTCGLEPGLSAPSMDLRQRHLQAINMQRKLISFPSTPRRPTIRLSDCYCIFSEEARKDLYGGILTPTPPGLLRISHQGVPGAQFPNDLGPEPHHHRPCRGGRSRHPKTWGWILESCWTLQTSWEMPPLALERRARGDLMDETAHRARPPARRGW